MVPDHPDLQAEAVIDRMRDLVEQDWSTPEIQADAAMIEAMARANQRDVLDTLFWHIKGKLTFVTDAQLSAPIPATAETPIVEVLIRPLDMSLLCEQSGCRRLGDCDDWSMYTAALLKALGYEYRFVTLAADAADPSRYSHVYVCAVRPDGVKVAMDTSHGPYLGWEHGNVYGKRKEWGGGGGLAAVAVIAALVIGARMLKGALNL